MASKEEISMIGFEIVAYAGDAQTDLIAACEKASKGDIDGARALHESAKQALIDAHDVQTRLLSQEAGGSEMDVTFIMVHAQDTLMRSRPSSPSMPTSASPNLKPGSPSTRRHQAFETTKLMRGPLSERPPLHLYAISHGAALDQLARQTHRLDLRFSR